MNSPTAREIHKALGCLFQESASPAKGGSDGLGFPVSSARGHWNISKKKFRLQCKAKENFYPEVDAIDTQNGVRVRKVIRLWEITW